VTTPSAARRLPRNFIPAPTTRGATTQEQTMKAKPDRTSENNIQGEGDKEAARRYNEEQKRFVDSGAVAGAAKRAKPLTDDEADEMQDAEAQGRQKAKGEDPTVPGANAKSKVGRRV
jgi:hypothetical protein